MAIQIYKDSEIVNVAIAEARKERIDSAVRENANKLIKDLASDPNPNNRYQISQLIKFAVDDIVKRDTNWLDNLADVKRVGFGDKAEFEVKLPGIKAFIQAKGSTTPRTKNAKKTVSLETLSVSARPFINIVELQNGLANAADVINDASYQMECAMGAYIQDVLTTAAATWAAPYYGTGSGLVKGTLDPMVMHWIRVGGGAAIFGDIGENTKLAQLTGFTANSTTQQFSGNIINEQNQNAVIGTYLSAKVVNLANPLKEDGTDSFLYDMKKLFIVPTGVDAGMRPLKVVFEGDVFSTEATNIDDLSWEIRLDQYFNAAIAKGVRPYLSMYADSSVG
jgi:hypothetical protein